MTYPIILSIISHETIEQLEDERHKQRKKFGAQPLADDRAALRIALEELGECAKALNQRLSPQEFRKELKQLAAVCIAHLDGDLHDGDQA